MNKEKMRKRYSAYCVCTSISITPSRIAAADTWQQLVRDRKFTRGLSFLFSLSCTITCRRQTRSEALKFHDTRSSRIRLSGTAFQIFCPVLRMNASHFTVPPQIRTKIMFICVMTFIYCQYGVKNMWGCNRQPNGAAYYKKNYGILMRVRKKSTSTFARSSSYESFRRNAPLSPAAR